MTNKYWICTNKRPLLTLKTACGFTNSASASSSARTVGNNDLNDQTIITYNCNLFLIIKLYRNYKLHSRLRNAKTLHGVLGKTLCNFPIKR